MHDGFCNFIMFIIIILTYITLSLSILCFITDMIRRRVLRTRSIKMLVLDEADEMLNKGFKEQIYDVYRYLPPATQVVLISATLPHEILEMTSKFMTDPIRILVKRSVFFLNYILQYILHQFTCRQLE